VPTCEWFVPAARFMHVEPRVRAKWRAKSGSVGPMTIRVTLFAFVMGLLATTGCARKQNKVMADTPVLPYQQPDIAEITGIEEDEDASSDEAPEPAPAPAPTPAAAPAPAPAPAAAPAAPTPGPKTAPVKAPAKAPAPAPAPAPKK
jgi:hypothetical protein